MKEIDSVPSAHGIDAVPSGVAHSDGRTYSNATPDHEKPVDKNAARCVACGGIHGGVGAGILCLEAEVVRLRAENRTLRMR